MWRRYKSESITRFCPIWKIHRGTTLSIQWPKFRGKLHINLLLPGLTGMQKKIPAAQMNPASTKININRITKERKMKYINKN